MLCLNLISAGTFVTLHHHKPNPYSTNIQSGVRSPKWAFDFSRSQVYHSYQMFLDTLQHSDVSPLHCLILLAFMGMLFSHA